MDHIQSHFGRHELGPQCRPVTMTIKMSLIESKHGGYADVSRKRFHHPYFVLQQGLILSRRINGKSTAVPFRKLDYEAHSATSSCSRLIALV